MKQTGPLLPYLILDPLLAARDELPGKHANTQIPKIIGAALAFRLTTSEPRKEITLRPFHELDYQRYTVYWKTTPQKVTDLR